MQKITEKKPKTKKSANKVYYTHDKSYQLHNEPI